jgi:hypothetical protein
MTYCYLPRGDDCFWIQNVETTSAIGHVSRQGKNWHVEDGERISVAVVAARSDAGRDLADYYKKQSSWQRGDLNEYFKWTEFGVLQVLEEEPGCWFVYRNAEQPLMRDGEAANFRTAEQAQRAADAHCSDGPAGSTGTSDGLSWLMIEKVGFPDASGTPNSKVIS